MPTQHRSALWRTALTGTLAALVLTASPARAQGSVAGGSADSSATVRLIQLLIQKGILTRDQASSLLSQAQSEAAVAPRHTARSKPGAVPIAPIASDEQPAAPGEVRVTYVPQFVRDQIATQVRGQVMAQVKDEGWARPNALPDWVQRVTVYGDFRMRFQGDYEDPNNAGGIFPDFNAINAGSGYDESGTTTVPTINVTQNRDRYRIRARIGVRAQIADWVSSDIRLATGSDNNPVSENQTLGRPGDFSKYAIYLDRAYVTLQPLHSLRIYAGREPNPYFSTDLMFAPDLNFDGVSAQYEQPITSGFGLFVNAGAYPVFNTDLNFSSTAVDKGSSHDAYLFAGQVGARFDLGRNYGAKFGVGYFAFSNVTGKESSPCLLLTSSDTCSTDNTRPAFLQFGNTVFGLRDRLSNSVNALLGPQYYGLASHFGILDAHGRFDFKTYAPVVVSLEGDFVKNLAYNRSYILARTPANNFGSAPKGQQGPYVGGDTGYMVKLTVGYPEIARRWDWNTSIGYKYLQSDAVIDAFTDSDFHLGGTNAKGYIVGGNLGVAANTALGVRWLSTSQVSGAPYGVDVLQIDLNTKF